ncbi:hypothetical protein [Haloferax sulfurifontis]|uniref:Uncharacterized protein n=1 Tax=Haloferax sulfurifontis ATCC BAA-897 TaxID=662480 RepID=M0ILZ5_9EURY|nr:hypothetical protein [Haloferax sulfurifontis]ELZ97836.1 hypothetical protein C441_03357 [Haloferax sulfurifontis ATCC BAA-897]
MSDGNSRVRLNLRVDEDVKCAFNDEVEAKFGKCRPYAGIELEREFRYFLDEGEFAELNNVVDDLTDSLDGSEGKEKIRETNRSKTTVASHRIAEDVRTALMSAAEDDFRSPGKLVEAIMYGYVTNGSAIERLTQKLRDISEQSKPDVDSSMGAKERRTKTIAHELEQSGPGGFTLKEFDEAIEAAQGIGASDYTRRQYLPRVLDELDFTWHPRNPDLFISRESLDLPEVRDPTKKPVMLVDRDDKRLAIKIAAYRAQGDFKDKAAFSVDDAVDLFEGRVRKNTVRPLMREVAESSPGYRWDRDDSQLKVDRKKVRRHYDQNTEVVKIEHEESTPVGRGD